MMQRFLALLVFLVSLVGAAAPAHAQEPYFGYDAFPTPQIDFTRWLYGERSRQIVGGALLMSQRDYGDQTGNSGTRRAGMTLPVDEPQRVTQLRASVTISDYELAGCVDNATPSSVQARVLGSFFGAGPTSAGSQLNDVIGLTRMLRRSSSGDAPDVFVVEGLVVVCTASDCASSTLVGTVQSLGTVTQGTPARLALEWDASNQTFYFQLNSDPKASVVYTGDIVSTPGLPFKQLDTRTELASCLSGPRTMASVAGRFDNVQVNSSALP